MLYRVVERHLPTFLGRAREHGGVSGFIEDALQELLRCGVLEHGLCRFRCSACRCERLVALSRAVLGLYALRARARGLPGAQTGAITFVQRFGSAANMHVHAHVLVMDGVFTATEDGGVVFHKLPAPRDGELRALLALVRCRVLWVGWMGLRATRIQGDVLLGSSA